ncbi:hypothetical protein Lalb_Chr06g0163631 [Lupinus albus]|uniref:Uncharacterized protein n=1 Tax=Lupinus albus TaxID=3870 RepID=A0A6A4QBA8_LUPAL|nr:hypothetical protein Lalb_Chr06g0163631 [Lupinus albus]
MVSLHHSEFYLETHFQFRFKCWVIIVIFLQVMETVLATIFSSYLHRHVKNIN